MISVIKAMLIRMGGTAIKAFFTKTMLIWSLRLYAKSTDNKVDDYSVDLLEALLENNVDRAAEAARKVGEQYLADRQERKLEQAKSA